MKAFAAFALLVAASPALSQAAYGIVTISASVAETGRLDIQEHKGVVDFCLFLNTPSPVFAVRPDADIILVNEGKATMVEAGREMRFTASKSKNCRRDARNVVAVEPDGRIYARPVTLVIAPE